MPLSSFTPWNDAELLMRLIVLRMESTCNWSAFFSSCDRPAELAAFPTRPCSDTSRLLTSRQRPFGRAHDVVRELGVADRRAGGRLFGRQGLGRDQARRVVLAGVDPVARRQPLQRRLQRIVVLVEVVDRDEGRHIRVNA